MSANVRRDDPRKVIITDTLAGLLLDRLQDCHKEQCDLAAKAEPGSSARASAMLKIQSLEGDFGALADAMTTARLARLKENSTGVQSAPTSRTVESEIVRAARVLVDSIEGDETYGGTYRLSADVIYQLRAAVKKGN